PLTPLTATAAFLHVKGTLLGGHRIVLDDLALEHPHLDADDSVSGLRLAVSEIDVGTQRVQRHAAFAIPLGTRDFSTTQTAGHVNADTKSTHTQRRLNGTLHRAAESDAAFQLLRDILGDQRRVNFRLADFDDIEMDFAVRQPRQLAAQLVDVGALLADQHAWPG